VLDKRLSSVRVEETFSGCQASLAVCRSLGVRPRSQCVALSPSRPLAPSCSRARAPKVALALFSLPLSPSLSHRQGGLKCGHPSPACQRRDRFVRTIRVLPGHAAGRGVPASCPLILGLRVHYTQYSYLRRSKHNGHFNPCDPCELVSTRGIIAAWRSIAAWCCPTGEQEGCSDAFGQASTHYCPPCAEPAPRT